MAMAAFAALLALAVAGTATGPAASQLHRYPDPVPDTIDIIPSTGTAALVLAAAAGFTVLHLVLVPFASRVLFGVRYTRLGLRVRGDWNARVVALVHALLVVPLAARALSSAELDEDRVFGVDRTGAAARVCAVAAGYFVWDAAVSAVVFRDGAFVLHGVLCCAIYVCALRPFLAYYAVRFLLWELSTPFLNVHWFLDKLDMTGSTVQRANGVVLLATFAGVRIVYGPYLSAGFLRDIASARMHPALFVAYAVGNVVLNALNFFWFYKMVRSVRRRFVREDGPRGSQNGTDRKVDSETKEKKKR